MKSTVCKALIAFSVNGHIYIICFAVFAKMTLRRRCRESGSNLRLLALKTRLVIIEKLYEI